MLSTLRKTRSTWTPCSTSFSSATTSSVSRNRTARSARDYLPPRVPRNRALRCARRTRASTSWCTSTLPAACRAPNRTPNSRAWRWSAQSKSRRKQIAAPVCSPPLTQSAATLSIRVFDVNPVAPPSCRRTNGAVRRAEMRHWNCVSGTVCNPACDSARRGLQRAPNPV